MELFTSIEKSLRDSSEGSQIDLVATQLQMAGAWFAIFLGFPEKGLTTAKRTLDWLNKHGYQNEKTYSLIAVAVGSQFLRLSPNEAIAAAVELSEIGNAMGSKWWTLRGKTAAAGPYFMMGDLEQAERYLKEHDQLLAETGGPWNSNFGLQAHARLAEGRGDYTAAKAINYSLLNSLHSVSFLRGDAVRLRQFGAY